jgi:hypothetical protein
MINNILIFTIFFIAFFFFSIRYRIKNNRVEFLHWWVFPVHRVRFDNIRDLRVIPRNECWFGPWGAFRYGNKLFPKKIVVIEKKKGVFKTILLTPDNPEEFVNEIKKSFIFQQSSSTEPHLTP